MSDKDANQVRDPAPAPAFYQLPPSGSAPRQVASSCPPALAATATATATAAADPRPSGKNNVVASASAAAFCLHEMRHDTKEEDDDYGDTL